MLSALFYLKSTSLQNRLRQFVRRLREPKYLVGAIVGAAYVWFFFLRRFTSAGVSGGRGVRRAALAEAAQALPTDWQPVVASLGALLLLLFVVFMWVLPEDKPGLHFTEAETAFLFPAPVSRRALIHYRLVSAQFATLVQSLFLTLLSGSWSIFGGSVLIRAVGWWVILSTLNLHRTGAAFTLTRLIERGVSPARRRVVVFAGIGLVLAGTAAWVWRNLQAPRPADTASAAAMLRYGQTLLDGSVLGWLLRPFKLVVAPILATDGSGFLLAFGPALALMAMHYLWVLRMEVSFEEASLDLAQKRSAKIAAWRSGQRRFGSAPAKARRGPFRLADTGRPEFAFLWKNLLSTASYFNLRALAWCAAAIVFGCTWLGSHAEWREMLPAVGIVALIAALYILFLGPQLARQDIRSDLVNADILKTYPLPGWQLLLGELLAPIAILSGLLWLTVLAAALAWQPQHASWLSQGLRLTLAVCLAVLAPPLTALQLLIPNAAAVVFPAWFQATRTRGPGLERIGQRLIFVFGQFVVILLALLPAALMAAAPLAFALWLFNGSPVALLGAVIAGTVMMLAAIIGEVWCGLWLLGARFEKLDLSAELRP
jgi:ABC-2 type transport system permease protein